MEFNDLSSLAVRLRSTIECLEKAVDDGTFEEAQRFYGEIDKIMWASIEPGNIAVMTNEILNRKMITSCRMLITGGRSFEEFSRKVREFDDSPACSLVWTPNFVAYRCRTCGLTPCMSLCSDCFLAGNHEGHDYNMFRSQAGGACDCGDASVMKESGFCPKHAACKVASRVPPEGLLTVARYILPHIYWRLLCYFREYPVTTAFGDAGHLIAFLQGLSDLGAAMKNVLCDAMTDEKAYIRLTRVTHEPGTQTQFLTRMSSLFDTAVDSVDSIATQDDADALDCPELCMPIEYQSFVDEFMFWLVKLEFPQKLITFLLSLLSNMQYKARFSQSFVRHYTRIATLLATTRANEVANRVIHMSVQLMSSEPLSLQLNKEQKLLRILVVCLHNMIKKGLTECTLHTTGRNFHRVADCSSSIMENRNYWALASDLHSVLGSKALVRAFLRDPALVDLWCNFIAFFQGMNVNTRQMEQHLEYESRAYYPAFTAEIEICSSIMWCLVRHLRDEKLYDCILYTVQYVLGQIQEWFENIHFVPESCWKPPRLSVTFHLPLHRLYAACICESIKLGMQVLFPSETFLRQLLMHPLQIQVARSEISAGMWVRNGQSMRYQSCLYVQSHFCLSFVDMDLYLLQMSAARVHPDWFVLTVFERFHLLEWLSFAPAYPVKRFLRPEWEMSMLEGALRLIATLICNTTKLGMSEEDVMRLEIATLLATGNKSHSQILDQLPDVCTGGGHSLQLIEKILHELAMYQPPQFDPGGTMRQGTYIPRDVVWLQYFDPLFVMLRSMQVKEYQDAFMRYTDFARRCGMYNKKGPPWAPMRVPQPALPAYDTLRRILHCRSLHGILYVILFKAVTEFCPVSEQALYLVVYLLELAVHLPPPGAAIAEAAGKRHTVLNLQFCGWFPGNCLYTNLCHRLDRILHIDNMPGLSRSYQDHTDTGGDFPDLVRLRAKLSGSSLVTTPDNQLMTFPVQHQHRSEHIPFIDSIETDFDMETDYFYKKAMACLPDALRRQYLASSPERLALTMDSETSATIKEVTEEMALVVASAEERSETISGATNEERTEETSLEEGPSQQILQYENGEQALVLKQPGAVVHSQQSRPITDQDMDSISLPAPEARRELPWTSPQPRSLPQPKVHVVNAGESLVTLLVKLHNKLSNDGQVYQSPDTEPVHNTTVVGNGVTCIKNLLDRIYFLTASCRKEIDSVCQAYVSPNKTSGQSSDDALRARKKAARERQQRLMAQFTSKQKAVMDQLLQQESSSATAGSSDTAVGRLENAESVDCVICNQPSSNLVQRPIGLVTIATPTSVFGKAYPEGEPFVSSIFNITETHKTVSRGYQESDYYRRLSRGFNKLSCISSTSAGWEGGIYLSTCGHFVHIDCHEAYMQSVRSDSQGPETGSILSVDKGEFFCPLCQQLANCILPSVPPDEPKEAELTAVTLSTPTVSDSQRLSGDVMNLLEARVASPFKGSPLGNSCDQFVLRLMETTYPRFSEFVSELNAVWAFMCGVVRTNLEARNYSNSIRTMQKRSCLRALLQVLPTQIGNLKAGDLYESCLEWSSLCNIRPSDQLESQALAHVEKEVPMVLKDPNAVLIRLILIIIQQSRSPGHISIVCQSLYNLVAVQSVVNVIEQCSVNALPSAIVEKARDNVNAEVVVSSGSLEQLASYILKMCYGDSILQYEAKERTMTVEQFCSAVESKCVPYLRVASLLKHYSLTAHVSTPPIDDVCALRAYVFGPFDTRRSLQWTSSDGPSVLCAWIEELKQLTGTDSQWRTVLARPLLWTTPRLVPLPKQFDLLFQRYHKAKCPKCGTAPKETLLCLVCGDLVCYHDTCCMSNSLTELEMHTVDCGAGMGVYVSVQSSIIIVTRDRKASHWGSLYLDAHGEEDKGLKRGKPLLLSEERFAMLEQHWLSHSFDAACKRWFWIRQTWNPVVIPM